MIIDYEDDGVIRWERNGEKKHAELIDLIEAYEGKQKHGRWIETDYCDYDDTYRCSVCGNEWEFIEGTPKDNGANYCPNCGARMDAQIGEDKSHPFAESVMMGMDEVEE